MKKRAKAKPKGGRARASSCGPARPLPAAARVHQLVARADGAVLRRLKPPPLRPVAALLAVPATQDRADLLLLLAPALFLALFIGLGQSLHPARSGAALPAPLETARAAPVPPPAGPGRPQLLPLGDAPAPVASPVAQTVSPAERPPAPLQPLAAAAPALPSPAPRPPLPVRDTALAIPPEPEISASVPPPAGLAAVHAPLVVPSREADEQQLSASPPPLQANPQCAAPQPLLVRARPELAPLLDASDPEAFGLALATAARAQSNDLVIYNDQYRRIAFPMGDVPSFYGVCTDVVIRAYRALGIDLQALVQQTRVGAGDPNIDHRRTETLRRFFALYGEALPISTFAEDYRPGDIVSYHRPQNRRSRSHIAMVAAERGASGRPMIIHNRGWGVQIEDALFVDQITGHYRFQGLRRPAAPRTASVPPQSTPVPAGALPLPATTQPAKQPAKAAQSVKGRTGANGTTASKLGAAGRVKAAGIPGSISKQQ